MFGTQCASLETLRRYINECDNATYIQPALKTFNEYKIVVSSSANSQFIVMTRCNWPYTFSQASCRKRSEIYLEVIKDTVCYSVHISQTDLTSWTILKVNSNSKLRLNNVLVSLQSDYIVVVMTTFNRSVNVCGISWCLMLQNVNIVCGTI